MTVVYRHDWHVSGVMLMEDSPSFPHGLYTQEILDHCMTHYPLQILGEGRAVLPCDSTKHRLASEFIASVTD